MHTKQRTISQPATISGIGLHTGHPCTLTFRPAPADNGVHFIRTDLPDSPRIKADIDNVVDIARGTTLAEGDAKVFTVEHVLAALAGLEIDNIDVELSDNEPPVMDGSSAPFVEILLKAGVEDQDADKRFVEIVEPLSYSEPERAVDLVVTPSTDMRITFLVDYNNPALGTQYTTLVSLEDEFVEEFAPARTFCFLSEVEYLRGEGLIKGGSLDNAVVISDAKDGQDEVERIRAALGIEDEILVGKTGIINDVPLRFPNEPVRHKALDLLGDLYLVGAPIKGHILAARSGHKANVALARQIRELQKKQQMREKSKNRSGNAFVDINGLLDIMPHRYPFLLIDRIIDVIPDKHVTALKNVTINEPFFQGHFPGHPIMPGVLILESLAQAGGVLLLNAVDKPQDKVVYFMSLNNVKFRKPVLPGDQLRLELEMHSFRRSTCKMSGEAYVDDKVVASADFMAMVMDR